MDQQEELRLDSAAFLENMYAMARAVLEDGYAEGRISRQEYEEAGRQIELMRKTTEADPEAYLGRIPHGDLEALNDPALLEKLFGPAFKALAGLTERFA